jgi:hypothetical protein
MHDARRLAVAVAVRRKRLRRADGNLARPNGFGFEGFVGWAGHSEVFGLQPCALGNPREHARSDLVAVVKGKHEVLPVVAG